MNKEEESFKNEIIILRKLNPPNKPEARTNATKIEIRRNART